jgi:hypothetical protein
MAEILDLFESLLGGFSLTGRGCWHAGLSQRSGIPIVARAR